jgi:hypothetical protein
MATIIARARRLSGFFGNFARRLYEMRLLEAEREVKRHRLFLDR